MTRPISTVRNEQRLTAAIGPTALEALVTFARIELANNPCSCNYPSEHCESDWLEGFLSSFLWRDLEEKA